MFGEIITRFLKKSRGSEKRAAFGIYKGVKGVYYTGSYHLRPAETAGGRSPERCGGNLGVSDLEHNFSAVMSALRKKRGLSQRKAAADLQISQALLSHYENGAREPGLGFVCRACDYYNVSADYLLGRVDEEGDSAAGALARARLTEIAEALRDLADRAEA